jgi:hypothetical protein
MERRIHYLFVDLGYLRDRYGSFAGRWFQGEGRIDFHAFYRHAHVPAKTFYYDGGDASAQTTPGSLAPRDEQYDRIRSAPGAHLQSAADATEHGQKRMAVQLAVDMLQHATRGKMTHATLLSGDADFAPLVRALVEIGIDVTVWAEAASAAPALRSAADHFLPISWQDYHHWTDERVAASALLPGTATGEISRLEGARESYARNGWRLLESGSVGAAGHRADLWELDHEPKQYSLAVEQLDGPEHTSVLRVSHSDRSLLRRYADIEWGTVSLSPAEEQS